MGLGLLRRKLIFKAINELCFLKRHIIVKESNFFRKYFYSSASSSVMLFEDSDSSTSSSGENSILVVPIKRRTRKFKGVKLFSVVVRVCKSLNWEVAQEIRFKKAMKKYGFSHSINAFRMIIHTYALAGMCMEVYALLKDIVFYFQKAGFDLYGVFHLFTDLHALPCNATVLVADVLIKVFAANKMLDCAVDVVKQARKIGLQPSIYSCNFLLKCLAEASMREHLLNLFEEMKSFESLPNVWTYTIMINFYCTNNRKIDIEEASKILEEMQKRQIHPSAATYSTYIHGLCKAGGGDFALNFIRQLSDNNKPLNCYCYNAIVRRFCDTGEVNKAISIFYEMKRFGIKPDIHSYSILIDGFCKCENFVKAVDLIEEMKANNVEPTIVSFSSLLQGFRKIRATEKAISMCYFLENSGYKYDQIAYDILIRGFCLMGSIDKASEYFSMMVQKGYLPDTITCNFIVNWFCTEGSLKEALELITEMVDQGIATNGYTYTAVIRRLCKDRKPGRALEVIPVMLKRNTFHVATCNTLIDGFVKLNLKKAYMLYEKIQKLGIAPDVITCTIVINGLCKGNEVRKAYKFFREMIGKGLNPDNIYYTSMIACFCKNGYVNEAFKLFKELPEKPSVVTYSCLIDGFCKKGLIDEANILLDEMRRHNVSPNVKTYDIMIKGFKGLEKWDLAYAMFNEMIKEGVLPDETIYKTMGLRWDKNMNESQVGRALPKTMAAKLRR